MLRHNDAPYIPWGIIAICIALVIFERKFRVVQHTISLAFSASLAFILEKRLKSGSSAINVLEGTLTLWGVQLNPRIINLLDLPFTCNDATVDRITLRVQRLGNSILLKLERVALTMETRLRPEAVSVLAHSSKMEAQAQKERLAKLAVVDSILWGTIPSKAFFGRLRGKLMAYVTLQLIRAISIRVEDVSLTMRVDSQRDASGLVGVGQTQSHNNGGKSSPVICVNIRSFSLGSQTGKAMPGVDLQIELNGLSLTVTPPDSSIDVTSQGTPKSPFQEDTPLPSTVVQRWNAKCTLHWRPATDLFHAGYAPCSKLGVSVFGHALLLRLEAPAMQALLSLTASVLHYYQFADYRRQRPQVPVAVSPQLWWQHAGRIVLQERAALRKPTTSGVGSHSKRQRSEYIRLYLHQRSKLRWLWNSLRLLAGRARHDLGHLEARLSDVDIARYRWWAMVLKSQPWSLKMMLSGGACTVTQDLKRRLLAVTRVAASSGIPTQHTSPGVHLKLQVTCPKVSVTLAGGSSGANNAPGNFLQLALEGMDGAVSLGDRLGAGLGEAVVQASCARFHVRRKTSHACATLPNWEGEDAPLGSPASCLLLCPSPKDGQKHSHFLNVMVKLPALAVVDSPKVVLAIAPADLVYCQEALLQLAAFHNEAWPTRELDPLEVHNAVCFKEIVADRLDKGTQQHRNQVQNLTLLDFKATMGVLRLFLPCGNGDQLLGGLDYGHSPSPPHGHGESSSLRSTEDGSTSASELPTLLVAVIEGFSLICNQTETATANEDFEAAGAEARQKVLRARRLEGMASLLPERGTIKAAYLHHRSYSMPVDLLAGWGSALNKGPADGQSVEGKMAPPIGRLQISASFHAYLGRSPSGSVADVDHCSYFVDPFDLELSSEHHIEPASSTNYRRVIQMQFRTSAIRFAMSQFVKRELHSLALHMAGGIGNDDALKTAYTRHFSQKGSEGAAPSAGNFLGGKEQQNQSSKDGGEVGGTHTFLISIHIAIPLVELNLVQCLSAEFPDHARMVFRVSLYRIGVSGALETVNTDLRFAVGGLEVKDLTEHACSAGLLHQMPEKVAQRRRGSRASLQRHFQAWRLAVAQQRTGPQPAAAKRYHFLGESGAQLSGRMSATPHATDVVLDGSVFCFTIELGTVSRLMQYAVELLQASPRQSQAQGMRSMHAAPAPQQANCRTSAQGRRTVQLFLHCIQSKFMVGKRVLATVILEMIDANAAFNKSRDVLHEVSVKCSSLQVIDHLAEYPAHRQPVDCDVLEGDAGGEHLLDIYVVQRLVSHAPEQHPMANRSGMPVGSRAPLLSSARPRVDPRRKEYSPQTSVRIGCDCLHVTFLSRFLYDVLYFGEEVRAITESLGLLDFMPSQAGGASLQGHGYAATLEVILTNCRVDIPRHSYSSEFYSFCCGDARWLLPASEGCLSAMQSELGRDDTSANRRSLLPAKESTKWLAYATESMDGRAGRPVPGRFSAISLASRLAGDRTCSFHHLVDGRDAGLVGRVSFPKLFWAQRLASDGLAMREVWDSGDLVVNLKPDTGSIKVWIPWLQAVFGEMQYELVLAAIWENAAEPPSFAPCPPPYYPVGQPLPPTPPEPTLLGVDKKQVPLWQCEVCVHKFVTDVEALSRDGAPPGSGASLGLVKMHDLQVSVAMYPCASLDIIVCSKGLLIVDQRFANAGGDTPVVVSIGPRSCWETEGRSSGSAWESLQESIRRSSDILPLTQQLAHRSSFKWEPLGIQGRHHRLSSFREASGTQGGANFDSGLGASQAMFGGDSTRSEGPEGFYLEYVIQAQPPADGDRTSQPGPHVLEIAIQHAQLTWPYMCQMDFIWDIAEVFSRYVMQPYVSPYPAGAGPSQWMYINVIIERSELFLPLPDASPAAQSLDNQLQPSRGLILTWPALRAGYFWGGDGETVLRIDVQDIAARARLQGLRNTQDVLLPFTARGEVCWHVPHDPLKRASTSAQVKMSSFKLQPSFGHVPLVHTARRMLLASVMACQEAAKAKGHDLAGTHCGLAPRQSFRSNSMHLNMDIASATVALIDDRYGHNIEVLAIGLQDVRMGFGRDESVQGLPVSTIGRIGLRMRITFLDSSVDATEPMVDMWPLTLEYRHTGAKRHLSLSSNERLNVVLTSSSFRSLGDLRAMVTLLSKQWPREDFGRSTGLSQSVKKWVAATTARRSSLYRLVNKSGLRLSYWTKNRNSQSEAFVLNTWEETPLLVEPTEKHVVLPDTQQQVVARTINMQFAGNWAPVLDVVIDKVGKYAYTMGLPNDSRTTPVIMDVSLDVRTKVLTVHSPFMIENLTSSPLEFTVHVFDFLHGLNHGASAISTVPGSGPLSPGLQCYLPVSASWGGAMYLRAVGWQMSEKDKIDLDGPKLRDKQGLYTCPGITSNQKPFHSCLEVQEDKIKVFARDSTLLDLSWTSAWVMRFRPPLVISNKLPYDITVVLADTGSGLDAPVFQIGVGGSVEVYQFDMTRKIRMSVQLKDYKSPRPVIIHYPPSTYLDDSTRRSVVGDLPGLRLPKDIILVQDSMIGDTARMFPMQGSRLTLRLHNKANAGSRARHVAIYCPYWIVNKSNLTLRLRDTSPQAALPSVAPPGLGSIAQPVLFSSARGVMRMCVHNGMWSRSINLESLGMNANFHMLGPTLPPEKNARRETVVENVLHLLSDQPIIPRGIDPSKRLFSSRGSSRRAPFVQPLPLTTDHLGDVSEEECVPQSQVQLAASRDAGHVLARFCLGAGSTLDDEETEAGADDGDISEYLKRYDFAVDMAWGPSIFNLTKVVTITSRFVVYNKTSELLQYGQRDTRHIWEIPSGTQAPFHWDDAHGRQEICVRPAKGRWDWSGSFPIDQVGDFGVRVRSPTGIHRILPVSISAVGASFQVTVDNDVGQPPYRIENRCESVKIRFQQRDLLSDTWEEVSPGRSQEYAWDEPQFPHRLRAVLDSADGIHFRDRAVHEYNLDVIKVYPAVKLRRSARVVNRVTNTMGRALSAGIAMGGMVGRSPSSVQVASQDQPELDARYVYVGVHADGPTRVLCFSETRDEYTRGTNEEQHVLLSAKLKHLQERLADVEATLQELEDANIDMGVVCQPILSANEEATLKGWNKGRRTLSRGASQRSETSPVPTSAQSSTTSQESVTRDSVPIMRHVESSVPHQPSVPRRKETRTLFHRGAHKLKKKVHIFVPSRRTSGARGKPPTYPQSGKLTPEQPAGDTNAVLLGPKPTASTLMSAEISDGSPQDLEGARRSAERGHQSPDACKTPTCQLVTQVSQGSAVPDVETIPGRADALKPSLTPIFPPASPAIGEGFQVTNSAAQCSPPFSEIGVEQQGWHSPAGPFVLGEEVQANTMAMKSSLPRQLTPSKNVGGKTLGRLRRLSRGGSLGLEGKRFNAADRPERLGEPLLGGELIVHIVNAQGLAAGWQVDAPRASASLGPKQGMRNRKKVAKVLRGNVYCVLQCEGQIKRTRVAAGRARPEWKEDVTFKSVQISSELKVSIFSRSRIGADVFLGEVVIPLCNIEVEGPEQPEAKRYTLARRTTKEQVSGDICLACSWRVTPLDVVHLKVKACQAELEQKEEVLALIQERIQMQQSIPYSREASRECVGVDCPPAGLSKRLAALRGVLDLKIVEAKNLMPALDLPYLFYSMDPYVTATVSSNAGAYSQQQTSVVRNNMAPRWNARFMFPDVGLADTLTLAVMDHKKLTPDILLGRALVPLERFKSCKPAYMWLPLSRRDAEQGCSCGEIRVRIQWMLEETEDVEDAGPTVSLKVELRGIGLSLVEASIMKLPREVMHVLFEDIHVEFKALRRTADSKGTDASHRHRLQVVQTGRIRVYSVQVDNQLLTSSHPVVLAQTASGLHEKAVEGDVQPGHPAGHVHHRRPFLDLSWEMLHHNSSIVYFRSVGLAIAPLDLVLEEDFLDRIVHILRNAPVGDIWQAETPAGQRGGAPPADGLAEALQELFDVSMVGMQGNQARGNRGAKWYFEKLELAGIQLNLTLIPQPGRRDDAAAVGRYRMAAALGTQFIEINSVPLKINVLALKNAFVSPRALASQVKRHFQLQALHEMHKILGQVDIVGSPILLGSSLVAGFRMLISEPAKARNAEEFVEGLGRGLLALSKNALFGFCNATGQLTGGMAKGMALLTLDEEYISRFRTRPMGYRQRLLYGLQAAGVGIYEGAVGIVREPVVGYQDKGILGAALGVYIGASGIILKPSSGLLQCFASTVTGVGAGIRQWGDEVVRVPHTRIRSPRNFGVDASGELRNVGRWQGVLVRLDGGKFKHEDVVDYLQNKENKALVFTQRRLLYINLKRQTLRWSFSFSNLAAVSTSGLSIILQQKFTVRLGKHVAHFPTRRHVDCRTRDLHQSLLAKLDRALARERHPHQGEQASVAGDTPHSPDIEQGDLHILNFQPPSPGRRTSTSDSVTSRLSALLTRSTSVRTARTAAVTPAPSSPTVLEEPKTPANVVVSVSRGGQGHVPDKAWVPKTDHRGQGGGQDIGGTFHAVLQLCDVAENAAPEDVAVHAESIVLLARTAAHARGTTTGFTGARSALLSIQALASSLIDPDVSTAAREAEVFSSIRLLALSAGRQESVAARKSP